MSNVTYAQELRWLRMIESLLTDSDISEQDSHDAKTRLTELNAQEAKDLKVKADAAAQLEIFRKALQHSGNAIIAKKPGTQRHRDDMFAILENSKSDGKEHNDLWARPLRPQYPFDQNSYRPDTQYILRCRNIHLTLKNALQWEIYDANQSYVSDEEPELVFDSDDLDSVMTCSPHE